MTTDTTAPTAEPTRAEPATPPPGSPPAAEPDLWRHGDFNRLWVGQSVSAMGSQITALALPLTAVLYLNASATQIGLMNGLREFAFLGLMLFAGVVVDRFRRRPLLIASDLGRAVLVALVPVLAFAGALTMPVLYAVAFGVGALTVLFNLAYSSYLPAVVDKGLLAAGNSRLQASESVAYIAGPGLGGVLVQVLRAPFALIADALSFLFSAAALAAIKAEEPPARRDPDATGARGVIRDIVTGLRSTVQDRVLRALAGTSATFNFFSGLLLTLFVVYATRTLGLSAGAIGVILGAFGVGGLAGALTLGKGLAKLGFGGLLIASYGAAVVAIIAVPFVAGSSAVMVALFSVIHFVVGWGIVGSNIIEITYRQSSVPPERLGRVNASFRFLIGASLPVSAVVAGVLGDAIGLRETLYLTSAGIGLSMIWLIASPVRRMRGFEPPAPEAVR